jgi:hypothetical protein
MNPLMLLLGAQNVTHGIGQPQGYGTDDLRGLTDALAAYKKTAGEDKSDDKSPTQSPIDRIKAAFDSLKDMHKGPDQTPENTAMLAGPNSPSPFDTMQWPYGPVGAPSQAQGASPPAAPQGPSGVPMPQPRPEGAPPPPDQGPMMSFFQRNTALQRDPVTGEYIDPASAAKANPGVFHGLF